MNLEKLNQIRLNVLDSPASMVPNNRGDLVELVKHTAALRVAAGKPGLHALRVDGLSAGVQAAPSGDSIVLHHERLHLLEWFEAIDDLTPAPPAPEPIPEPAPEPLPE